MAQLEAHRKQLIEVVPGRTRIGVYDPGLCSNEPNWYWNGGVWTLVTGPMMIAQARTGRLPDALDVADRLANHTIVSEVGYYEEYNGVTGQPGKVKGLLMNNGGILWGLFEGVLGIVPEGDALRLRDRIPAEMLPCRARIHYRGRDLLISWVQGEKAGLEVDGVAQGRSRHNFYCLENLGSEPAGECVIQLSVTDAH